MSEPLTRTAASAAVDDAGWRYLLGTLRTTVPVAGLAQDAEVVRALTAGMRALRLDTAATAGQRPVQALESAHHPSSWWVVSQGVTGWRESRNVHDADGCCR